MLVFRQLFDAESSTYTYLLGDDISRECLLIDPVNEKYERDLRLIEELGLRLKVVLDTHCHADHVTAAWTLSKKTEAKIGISMTSGAEGADLMLKSGDKVYFGQRFLLALATPGHTSGCITFVLDDRGMAFTGDTILVRGCGRTDFQEGDPAILYQSIYEEIFRLPDDTKLYPGHDYNGFTVTSVIEEKVFNQRLRKEVSQDDFQSHMKNIRLDMPKKIDSVLPVNLKCGAPVSGGGWSVPNASFRLSVDVGYDDGGGI